MRSTALAVAMVLWLPATARGQVDRLAWLTGCWQIARGDEVIDEQWMSPRGGVMLGMSRTTRGDRTTATEFVTLRVSDGRVAYEANPSGQTPTSFPATMVSAERAVFENPAHDYPKRIVYERRGDDGLVAAIDDGSGAKRVEYPFRRVMCR